MNIYTTANKLVITLSLFMVTSTGLANYKSGQSFFQRRDYVNAAGQFFQAYGYPRTKGERAKAEWGLAQSLYNLGYYYSASKYYSRIVRRGPRNNAFFRPAMEELGKINATISLGQSHVVQLFKARIDPADVPGPARGFYFYYLGMEAFSENKFEKAKTHFKKVNSNSKYYVKSIFHLGVISNLQGDHSRAISYFQQVLSGARSLPNSDWVVEQALINIARVHYETKRYRAANQYYARVPRDSQDNWLQVQFEASWSMFMMQDHNLTLGLIHTIHSPFFYDRFYPESYILQAITFLRLCRFSEVRQSLNEFKGRYKGTFTDVRAILGKFEKDPRGLFKLVYDYREGGLKEYRNAWAIFDSLSRTDIYKEARNTIRFSDKELARLGSMRRHWAKSGLLDELQSFLRDKKQAAVRKSGRRLYNKLSSTFAYLSELSRQTTLIMTDMALNRLSELRSKLKTTAEKTQVQYIGGLQELDISDDLEYWPFIGEYWEDELGSYVYNIASQCSNNK